MAFNLFNAAGRDVTDRVAFYTFDEGASADHAAVMDRSPEGNDGTLYGAEMVSAGEEGCVLALDGRAAFAKCAHLKKMLFGGDDFSVDFWIKLESLKPGVVMGKKGESLESPGWMIEVAESGTDLRVTLADGSVFDVMRIPLDDPEQWHYVAVVREGETLTAYVDGVEAAKKTSEIFGGDISNNTVFLHLGRIFGNWRVFSGWLDDVAIWRRALDAQEIADHYKMVRAEKIAALRVPMAPIGDSLVLHYRFDSDPEGTAADLSGHGHDGKIIDGEYLKPSGEEPGALRFNGESAYIDIPKSKDFAIEGDMTFEMWVRQNATQKYKRAVLFGQASPGARYLFSLEFDYNLLFFYASEGPYGNERAVLPVTRKLLGSDWAHLAVVVEYPRCRFYRNGQLVRDQFMPIPGVDGAAKALRLGGEPENDYYAPIDVREFRLHRRALAPEEIAAHAAGEEFSGVVAAELAVEPDWYEGTVTVRSTQKGEDMSGKSVTLSLSVDGKKIAEEAVSLQDRSENNSGRFVAAAEFPLAGLEGAAVEARVEGLSPDGEAVTRELALEKPAWIQNQAGNPETVPAPWTPVRIESQSGDKLELAVWGRGYVFDRFLLPSQITAADANLLSAPAVLAGEIDGDPAVWKPGAITVVSASDEAVELEQILTSGTVSLKINAVLAYDGFLRYRVALSSDEDVDVDRLTLDIPLQTKHAAFCYADRAYPLVDGNYVATFHSGAVKGDLGFLFSPNVWIGDDERGLTWQTESDQYWSFADPQKALEIQPRGTTTHFLANMISKPVALAADEKRTYEFALLATPVKPLARDAWELRVARYEPWGTDFTLPDRKVNGKPELEVIADQGVRRLYSYIQDAYAWPMPLHEKFSQGLSRLVKAVHEAGLKIHPYLIHQRVAVEVPEFDLYGTDMANRPMKTYSAPINWPRVLKRPGAPAIDYGADSSSTVFMCAKSEALRDAYVNSLDQRLEKYGEDGVYLDGTVHIGPLCFNEAHGCGYRDDKGELHGTYPTFAIRELMRRIYNVVKKHRPDGVVDVHCSFGYNPSGLAYADIMWTGEQWHHLRKTGTDYVAEELTLDKFRTEFTGRQLGIAAQTLHYRLRHPMKIAATSLLLDISPRYSTGGYDNATQSKDSYFALMPKLWKMRETFGAAEAEKLYYYNNQDYVTVTGDKCHATLFKHPTNGVLAFVSNRSRETQDVKVRFNLAKLGVADRPLQPIDALTGEKIAMTAEGEIVLPLGSEEWKYVWLKPSEKVANPVAPK